MVCIIVSILGAGTFLADVRIPWWDHFAICPGEFLIHDPLRFFVQVFLNYLCVRKISPEVLPWVIGVLTLS